MLNTSLQCVSLVLLLYNNFTCTTTTHVKFLVGPISSTRFDTIEIVYFVHGSS